MFPCSLRSRPEWGPGGIIFIPQTNYATQGTLAAQVVRGQSRHSSPFSESVMALNPDMAGADHREDESRFGRIAGITLLMKVKGWTKLGLGKDRRCLVEALSGQSRLVSL